MATVLRGNDNFDSASPVSTTAGAVGTYVMAYGGSGSGYTLGSTAAGSSLVRVLADASAVGGGLSVYHYLSNGTTYNAVPQTVTYTNTASLSLSGTWRAMSDGGSGYSGSFNGPKRQLHLWVRIS